MKCKQCGAENPDNWKFCSKCGSPLEAPADDWDAPELEPVWTPSPSQSTEDDGSKNILGGIGALVVLLSMVFPFMSWIGEYQIWDMVDGVWPALLAIVMIIACYLCFKGSRGAGAMGGAYLIFEIVIIADYSDYMDWGMDPLAGFWLGIAGSVMMIISACISSNSSQQTNTGAGVNTPAGAGANAVPDAANMGALSVLFHQQDETYQIGAPVFIQSGKLLKNDQNGMVMAQLELQSLSDKTIKAVKVALSTSDVFGNSLGAALEYQYLDLAIQRGGTFGKTTLIPLPNLTTRSFAATAVAVVYADGSIWLAKDTESKPIPKSFFLETVYPDKELRKQFDLEFGGENRYAYSEFMDLCRCSCGAVNRQQDDKCHACGRDLTALRKLDITALELRKKKRLEQEYIAEQQRLAEERYKAEQRRIEAEKLREQAERRAAKAKKVAIIVAIVVCVTVAAVIVVQKVIVPNRQYNDAVELLESGEPFEAYKAFVALDGYKDSMEQAEAIYDEYMPVDMRDVEVGDVVRFGSYEQNGSTFDGKEDIEWRVLAIEDNRVLLISEYILDCQPYNEEKTDVTWADCTLRSWLNEDFLNAAFAEDEQYWIQTTTVEAEINPQYGVNAGSNTQDKVFLLSFSEVYSYFDSESDRKAEVTAYVKAEGAKTASGFGVWWLRTPGETFREACVVYYNGAWLSDGSTVNREDRGVRPAIWVELGLQGN